MILVHGTREDTQALRDDVAAVLAPLGLRLSPAKTQVVHMSGGFDFLGFRIQWKPKRGSGKWYVYTFIDDRWMSWRPTAAAGPMLPSPGCTALPGYPPRFASQVRSDSPSHPRAVADAVWPMTDLADARAVVAEAVQRGRCSIQYLGRELDAGPVQGSGLLRRALAEVAEGIRSAVEGDLRDLIRWARLPAPLYNPRLLVDGQFLAIPDCWWPESGVAGEADSRAWHFSPDDWERTLARHARMSAYGIIVLHLTPQRVRYRRREVADEIRRALAAGRQSPQIRTI